MFKAFHLVVAHRYIYDITRTQSRNIVTIVESG
jgi:hypothetical protein